MAAHTLTAELFTPRDLPDVFAFFEDPYNLVRITPPWLNLKVTNPEKVVMRKGAEITYRIRWMYLPVGWRTLITEYAPPSYFVDEQLSGPYTLWRHQHTFTSVATGGTLVKDRVEYRLPLAGLGEVAHSLMVRRQLTGIFNYRQKALTEILGAGTRPEPVKVR